MRLEIIVPDTTRPDLMSKLTTLTQRLSAQPKLVEDLNLSENLDDDAIQRLFTPELFAQVAAAEVDVENGNYLTLEQLDARLAGTRAKWLAENNF